MRYTIEVTQEAIADLAYLKKSAQVLTLDAIEKHLTYQANQERRNRKPLRPDSRFEWELRIGSYRVFYNVNEIPAIVSIVAVGYKKHNKLYIKDQEVQI